MVFNIDIYIPFIRDIDNCFLALDDSAVEKREKNATLLMAAVGKEIILTEEILSIDWECSDSSALLAWNIIVCEVLWKHKLCTGEFL